MISKNELRAFKILPQTVTTLSKKLDVSPAAASKITDKLINNGLATKQRNGKAILIEKEKTILAQKLEEIRRLFPRLPLEDILTYSHLTAIATLTYPLKTEELRSAVGVTRQWIHKTITDLSKYGIILKDSQGYFINPTHRSILEFAIYYSEFQNYKNLSVIINDAIILWQHGNEFLFKTKQEISKIPKTAVTIYSNYHIPLISEMKYYYCSQRILDISDTILHTILIDSRSKTYNSYALLLYEKKKPKNLLKKSHLYNLTQHAYILINFLETHTPSETFLPTWNDYQQLKKQYEV
jgi:predicted transcriptional regulator